MRLKNILKAILIIINIAFCACKKSGFLNAKPNINLNVPTTLSDFQSLMDNYDVINQTPGMGDLNSDNYFLSYSDWQSLTVIPQNCYIWAKDIFEGTGNIPDWDLSYQQIFIANVVLDGLSKIDISSVNLNTYKNIKGSAYFIRANAFFNLAQLFSPAFDSATSNSDLGIPLHLTSDVNVTEPRSSLANTYAQIISDLTNAKDLLQNNVPNSNIDRPIKPASFALLSKVYLSMRNYPLAGIYADSALMLCSSLIDYNTLNQNSRVPFSRTNAETMFQAYQVITYPLKGSFGVAQVDTILYRSYADNDLRKQIFFRVNSLGRVILKGTYNGTYYLFSGMATNEMYLNRAECFARAGNISAAISDLNTLLANRYITGTYIPKTASSTEAALDTVLTERRKELPFSNVRWTDIRRLNKENENIVLYRILNGQNYSLMANSDLYTLPIPPDEIAISGILQNAR